MKVGIFFLPPSRISTSDLERLAGACGRFTPLVAVREQEAVFLDMRKSLHLFPEHTLRARIPILIKKLGCHSLLNHSLNIRITFAKDIYRCIAKAYFPEFDCTDGTEDLAALPLEAAFCFLDPFNLERNSNSRVTPWIENLKKLGIRNLQELINLPVNGLGTRFGVAVANVYSSIQGEREPAWRGLRSPETVEEQIQIGGDELETVESTLENILFPLKTLVDRAMTRLRGLNKRASCVEIEFELAPWSIVKVPLRRVTISFSVAQGTFIGILPLLRERLADEFARDPLITPLRGLKFRITQTVPGHGIQRDFFSAKELENEEWEQLLGRLQNRLGIESVFCAEPVESHCPEQSWKRSWSWGRREPVAHPPSWSDAHARPSRILKTPEPVILSPSRVEALGQGSGVGKGKSWKVKSWRGPERISTQWWMSPSVERDYFQVYTEDHEVLWVYIDSARRAFLHGYFD